MCELYYLDHFRPEVVEDQTEAEAVNDTIDAAEDAMGQLPERLAKVMLDTAFVEIDKVYSLDARQRLLRYAVELCSNLRNDVSIELDFAAMIEEQLESKETD